MTEELFFIPIIQDALAEADPRAAMVRAFDRIDEMGRDPSYRVGYEQFRAFMEAATTAGEALPPEELGAAIVTQLERPEGIEVLVQRDGQSWATFRFEEGVGARSVQGAMPGMYRLALETGRLLWEQMAAIENLMKALDEREIAQQVGLKHDEVRMSYPLASNTVGDFDEFTDAIGSYYNHHFTKCISNGGAFSKSEASGRAKEVLEQEYRRRNGDIVAAFNDAHDGTNGGMRVILDTIAERIKAESVERYVRDAFDRHVAPNSWDDKVEIIRQFIEHCRPALGSSIDGNAPERYAQNFQELIRSYVQGLQRTSSVFRRL